MISPGTIRAASLVSKGMSPDAALREANRIDILTESRRSFIKANPNTTVNPTANQSFVNPSASTGTQVASGEAGTIAPKPSAIGKGISLGNVSSLMSDTTVKASKDFTKDEVDAINKVANSVQDPAVRKKMSLGNPNALMDLGNTEDAINKLTPTQKGNLVYGLGSALINSQFKSISKENYVPKQHEYSNYNNVLLKSLDKLYTDYNTGLFDAPTSANVMQEEHKKKLSSYQNLTNSFLNAKDITSLKKAYDSLDKEINFIDEEASAFLKESKLPATGVDFTKAQDKKDALKREIAEVYNNRASAMFAKQTAAVVKDRYQKALEQDPNLDANKFFENLTKNYNLEKSAFGLGEILVEEGVFGNYQDYIRFINPEKYSKKFTVEDPEFTGRQQGEWGEIPAWVKKSQDVSSWALEYSKFSPKQSAVSKDYRFRDTKEDLLFSGIQFATRVSEELYSEDIANIRERELLKLELQKKQIAGTLTEDELKKTESQISDLSEKIEYGDAFGKAIPSIYNYDNLKKNKVYKNFAQDQGEFLEKTELVNAIYNGPDSKWYDDIGDSFFHKNFFNTQTGATIEEFARRYLKGGLNLISEAVKFTDQTILNKSLGVPQSSDFSKRNAIYNAMKSDLDVPDIIDERASALAGKPINANDFFWKEKGSAWYDVEFNGRAAITGGAETLPQMLMFNAAGRGVQSLAGSAAQAGLRSGTTSALLGQQTANRFASLLSKTKSTNTAWIQTFNNSNNVILKKLVGERLPSAIGMSALIYPETYNRNLERLEAMGVKNPETIARNVATLSTVIEVAAENIIPNIRYLDDFAEKGTGLTSLLSKNKLLKKWIGDVDQYRSLYSGILGGKFSEKTVNYLARNSAEMFGKVGAAGRFYISRGAEEGIEEVFSEIVNGVVDNTTNFASYRREAPQPLNVESILNAFAGGFFIPSAGGMRQMKVYSQNKKYSAMYDMMVNADYYRNHINQEFKNGTINEEQAASMLSKLQEITSIADEYGVQNLKRRGDAAQFTADLVNDPEKQFDYFKQILVVKGIEDKLAKEGDTLKEEDRKGLLEEAEEATKRIDKYKRQASVFENMTQEQKDQIVSNTIAEKTKTARFFSPSQILAESVENADIKLAQAIKNKEPEHRIQALKDYRNALIQVNERRSAQKQSAIDRNTYNPLTAANSVDGEPVPMDLSDATTFEDLVDLAAQALIDPEKGAELDAFMRGRTQQELADLEADRENLVDIFLDHLEQTAAAPSAENSKESAPTTADAPAARVKYKTIADLSAEQREIFEDFVEALEEEYVSKKQEVEKYESLLNQVLTHGALKANMSLEQQETFADNVYKRLAAIKKIGFDLQKDSGAELFDTVEFGLYLERNKAQINKIEAEIEAEVQKQKDAKQVEREEVSLDPSVESAPTTEEVPVAPVAPVTVPELLPADVTPTFESALQELQDIVDQIQVEVTQNEITGQTETTTALPRERARVLNTLIQEMIKNSDIKGAQAMMASVMQVLGKSQAEIQKTLLQMEEAAQNKPVNEADYTHMFAMYQLARMTTEAPPSTQAQQSAAEDLGVTLDSDVETKKVEIEKDENGEFIPKKYNATDADADNPAPIISINAIDPKSFEQEELPEGVEQVRLLEISGRNSEGKLTGVALIKTTSFDLYTDVVFNDKELAALKPPTSTQPTDARADIERKRQEELFNMLSEENKRFALKLPEGDKRNKWVKTQVNKTTEGSDVIERHAAEDALNTSTDIATRIAAKRKLESNQPFNLAAISDIDKTIFKIKNNEQLISGDKIIKKYYDAELAALESAIPTVEKEKDQKTIIEEKIAKLENQINSLAYFIGGTDSFAAIKQAEKDIAEYKKEIKKLQEDLAALEAAPAPAPTVPTQEQKDEVANQSKTLETTPIFYPSQKDAIDVNHYEIQDRIITGLDNEIESKKEVTTALVDLFTIIEEVLGEEALVTLERIFNDVTAGNVSQERLKELRKEFAFLFPAGFMRNTALRYIFDDIMVKGVAQTDVTEKGKVKLDATDSELIALNEGKFVSIKTADGREYPLAKVTSNNGVLSFVIQNGAGKGKDLPLVINRATDKITGLKYPMLGTRPLQFSDLNAPYFTVLGKDGKVQKYSDDGNRNEEGDKVMMLTLPTSKFKPNPTDLEKQFNTLRGRLVAGERVKISAPVQGKSKIGGIKTIQEADGTSKKINSSHSYTFSAENLEPESKVPNEATVHSQQKEAKVIGNQVPVTQESTVAAVEKMIADSKKIPDPSKEGYQINGKKYERQSNFVKRVLGENTSNTEDSVTNMEKGAAVGNLLDIIGRDVLGGFPIKKLSEYIDEAERMGKSLRGNKGYSLFFTEEQFKQLLEELTEVKEELTAKGWKLFTEGLIVHREFTEKEKKETGFEGVAGAMDILAVDPEGRVHVIDFKNKKYRTQDKFTSTLYSSKGGFPSNVSKWSIQQTTYAILGEDFDLPVDSISILAFASEYNEEGGVITIDGLTLGSRKAEVLDKHKSPVSKNLIRLSFDPKIIKHLELRTESPSKKQAVEEPVLSPTQAARTSKKVTKKVEPVKKEQSVSQLNIFEDQPRLTEEEIAERDEKLRREAEERAAERERLYQEALADEELYLEYSIEKDAFKDFELVPEAQALSEMSPTRDSFVQFSDKRNLEGSGKGITLNYLAKKGKGFGLDQIAQRASDIAGREITPQDLVDFILQYPGGIGSISSKSTNTYFGYNNPDNDPRYSSIRDLIEQREKDAKRQTKRQKVNKLKENLPKVGEENAENVFDVLNSLGIEPTDLDSILPSEDSIDPSALNPPTCK